MVWDKAGEIDSRLAWARDRDAVRFEVTDADLDEIRAEVEARGKGAEVVLGGPPRRRWHRGGSVRKQVYVRRKDDSLPHGRQ